MILTGQRLRKDHHIGAQSTVPQQGTKTAVNYILYPINMPLSLDSVCLSETETTICPNLVQDCIPLSQQRKFASIG